jgi:hypothetical protein
MFGYYFQLNAAKLSLTEHGQDEVQAMHDHLSATAPFPMARIKISYCQATPFASVRDLGIFPDKPW